MIPTTATKAKETICVNGCSIFQLTSTYPRERLFVHPLIWTARHLDLLHCQFTDGGTITIASPPPYVTQHDLTTRQEQPNIDALSTLATPATLPSPGSMPADGGMSELQRYHASLNSEFNLARRLARSRDPIVKQRALSELLGGLKCCR